MFEWLISKTVNNYKDTENKEVRERYGIIASIFSIALNIIMVIFKLTFGYLTGSVAIVADGYNNLSDIGSNVATLFGFKLAGKHPDSEHPYGHGRIEYIVGMVIAFLILLVGLSSLKEAVIKILAPEEIRFSSYALIALIVSIGFKLWMAYFNSKAGKAIDSSALMAASQDSINDVISTTATLISLVASLFVDWPLDGIIGTLVSLLVLKSGIEIFKDMMTSLLGRAPDPELVKEIQDFVMSYPEVLGIHDLMIHDYGPGRKYMTLHAEVNQNRNIADIHDQIDEIERAVLQKFQILTTIHMDPLDTEDEYTNMLKKRMIETVHHINPSYNIHDFRVVRGNTHTNLIFDVVLPPNDTTPHSDVKKAISEAVSQWMDGTYYCVVEVEHQYY